MAIQEIRVRNIEKDAKGQEVISEVQRTIGIPQLEKVQTARVYRLEGTIEEKARMLAEKLFCDPITQEFKLNEPLITNALCVVEVAYKPGVMNPESASILKAAKDLGVDLLAADSSTEYAFYGNLNKERVEEVVDRLLVNKTVERVVYEKPETLVIKGETGQVNIIPIRNASPDDLTNHT